MKEHELRGAFEAIRADSALVERTLARLRERAAPAAKPRHRFAPRLAGALAAIALAVAGSAAYRLYTTPDAFVSVDVNPSVEFRLNRLDRVVGTYAFNEDGARILRESDLEGLPYDQAAARLVDAMDAGGYLTEDAVVSVTVQAENPDRQQLLCDTLQSSVNQMVSAAHASAQVEVIPVTAEIRGEAHGCHMSPAKYLAIQELLEVDEEATLEAYSEASIGQIRQRTQQCRDEHAGGGYGHGHGATQSSQSAASDGDDVSAEQAETQATQPTGQGQGHSGGEAYGHGGTRQAETQETQPTGQGQGHSGDAGYSHGGNQSSQAATSGDGAGYGHGGTQSGQDAESDDGVGYGHGGAQSGQAAESGDGAGYGHGGAQSGQDAESGDGAGYGHGGAQLGQDATSGNDASADEAEATRETRSTGQSREYAESGGRGHSGSQSGWVDESDDVAWEEETQPAGQGGHHGRSHSGG